MEILTTTRKENQLVLELLNNKITNALCCCKDSATIPTVSTIPFPRTNMLMKKTSPSFDWKSANYAAFKSKWILMMGDKLDVGQHLQLQHSVYHKVWNKVEHYTTMTPVWDLLDCLHGSVDVVVNGVPKNVATLNDKDMT